MPSTERTLQGDCDRCAALCCVAPQFVASQAFAFDKAAGSPCPHLAADDRCSIHTQLRASGMRGCTVYDCFGAGQRVTQDTFRGQHWRDGVVTADEMFAAFHTMRPLHELLWMLREAGTLGVHQDSVEACRRFVEGLATGSAHQLRSVHVGEVRARVNKVLVLVCDEVRSRSAGPQIVLRGADLFGADLRGRDLRGASLRGATLVAADLRGTDLCLADLTGADLRGAQLHGADLTRSLFVTQSQLNSAVGDATTRLSVHRKQPSHWSQAVASGRHGLAMARRVAGVIARPHVGMRHTTPDERAPSR